MAGQQHAERERNAWPPAVRRTTAESADFQIEQSQAQRFSTGHPRDPKAGQPHRPGSRHGDRKGEVLLPGAGVRHVVGSERERECRGAVLVPRLEGVRPELGRETGTGVDLKGRLQHDLTIRMCPHTSRQGCIAWLETSLWSAGIEMR